MSRNPILALWAAIGRVRLNPWIGYVALTWILVAIPLYRLVQSGPSRGTFFDLAILVLVATVFTMAARREARREEEELNLLASGALGSSSQVLSPREIDALLEQGTNVEALNAVEAAIGTAPRDPSLWSMWARCQLANEQPRLAIRGIDRALTLDPNHTEALYLRAWSKRNYWDYNGARAAAEQGLAVTRSHSGLRFEQRESTRMIEQWSQKKALPKQHRATPGPTPKTRPKVTTPPASSPQSNPLTAGVVAPLAIAQTAEQVDAPAPAETPTVVETTEPAVVEDLPETTVFQTTEPAETDDTSKASAFETDEPAETDDMSEASVFEVDELPPSALVEVALHEQAPLIFPAGDIDLSEYVVDFDDGDIEQVVAREPEPAQSSWGDFDISGLLDEVEQSVGEESESVVALAQEPSPEPLPDSPAEQPAATGSRFANLQSMAAVADATLTRVAQAQAEEAA